MTDQINKPFTTLADPDDGADDRMAAFLAELEAANKAPSNNRYTVVSAAGLAGR